MKIGSVKDWVLDWFEKNSLADKNDLNQIHENYFGKGWVDSLKFIQLVSDIESEFKISVSNNEFQDRTFSTIEGLIKIVEGKTNEKL